MSATTPDKFPTDFVPVSRPLVEELGYQAAYIFGIIWNYCQMEKGFCDAAHETIADRADMSRRSVIKYIDILIEAGYIEDLTPDVRNAPHQLCTKKGVQNLHSRKRTIKEEGAEEEAEECGEVESQEPGGSEIPAHQNGNGVQDLPSGCEKVAQLGVQNLHLKRQSEETDLKELVQDEEERTRMREEKVAAVMGLYQNNITLTVNPITAQEMLSDEFLNLPFDWWEEAVKIASDNNIRKWSYVRGVLSRSIQAGLSPVKVGPPINQNGASNGNHVSGKYVSPTPGNRPEPAEGTAGTENKITARLLAISRTGSDSGESPLSPLRRVPDPLEGT